MIIPSIDIMNGKAVQLRRGEEKVLEESDVLALARRFGVYGEIALIDLDRAMRRGENRDLVRLILETAECRVGGGIDSVETAREILSWGATRVIVGSRAFPDDRIDRSFLEEMRRACGRERVIVAVDARGDEIVTRGWQHRTGLDVFAVASELEPYCSELLFTCVEKEGMMGGTDRERIARLQRSTGLKITAAGGAATLEEIGELSGQGIDVQLGMALYTGAVDLAEGFVAGLNWRDGLLPTIARDERGEVLMLAWSSPDSLRQAFRSGRMCYFSRSRNELWTKGMTSGHFQDLVRIRTDCDRDTLLATVRQHGPACHRETPTCFGFGPFSLEELEEVIGERLRTQPAGSYTASLTTAGVREKIAEEAEELIRAESKAEVTWEAADLIYFTLLYMARQGVPFSAVLKELARRRQP